MPSIISTCTEMPSNKCTHMLLKHALNCLNLHWNALKQMRTNATQTCPQMSQPALKQCLNAKRLHGHCDSFISYTCITYSKQGALMLLNTHTRHANSQHACYSMFWNLHNSICSNTHARVPALEASHVGLIEHHSEALKGFLKEIKKLMHWMLLTALNAQQCNS